MLVVLAVLLAVAWLFGFAVFHVSSVAIHLLIVLAIVSVIAHFFGRRRMV